MVKWPSTHRYSYLGRRLFGCPHQERDRTYAKLIGQLVFELLELQLDGKRLETLLNEFSVPPSPRGCNSWGKRRSERKLKTRSGVSFIVDGHLTGA